MLHITELLGLLAEVQGVLQRPCPYTTGEESPQGGPLLRPHVAVQRWVPGQFGGFW